MPLYVIVIDEFMLSPARVMQQRVVWHGECTVQSKTPITVTSKEVKMEAKIKLRQTEIEALVAHSLLNRSFNKAGLCAYCKRNPICTMSHENGLVFDCSDYEDGDTYLAAVPLSTLSYEFGDETESSCQGLCRNCSRQKSCALSSDPSGIWHCEEYRQ